jgi:hypothetical protein
MKSVSILTSVNADFDNTKDRLGKVVYKYKN